MDVLKILILVLFLLFPIAELGKVQLGLISFTINDILVSFIFCVWIARERTNIFKTNAVLKKPIILFGSVSLITLLLNLTWLSSSEFLVSILYLVRWLLYSSLYFILIKQDKVFIHRLKNLLTIPILFFILLGYIQYVFYQDLRNLYYLGWDEHLYRLFSTFLDPNFAGAFFVLTLLYLLFLFIKNHSNKPFMIFLSLLSVLNLIAIYLTYSRSALIMLSISLLIFLFLINKKMLIFISFGILVLLVFISPKAFQTEGTNLLRIASVESRVDSAKTAIDIFSKNPVFGVGFNSYRFAQYRYGYLKEQPSNVSHAGAGTDNSYLFILATTGIIGLISYIFLVYKMFYLTKNKKNLMSKVMVASLAGVLINSLFINSLFYVYIMQWTWVMTAFTENS